MKLNRITNRHFALSGISFEPAIATIAGKKKKFYKISLSQIILLAVLNVAAWWLYALSPTKNREIDGEFKEVRY